MPSNQNLILWQIVFDVSLLFRLRPDQKSSNCHLSWSNVPFLRPQLSNVSLQTMLLSVHFQCIFCYINSCRLPLTLHGSGYRATASKSLPAAPTSISDGTKLANMSWRQRRRFKAKHRGFLVCYCVLKLRQLVNLDIPDAATCATSPSGTRCQRPACRQLSPDTRQSSFTWWMAARCLLALTPCMDFL